MNYPIQTGDVCEATGIQATRLHRWAAAGIISPLPSAQRGTGRFRLWDPAVIPIIRTLIHISDALGHGNGDGASAELLRGIAANHHHGRLDLGHGVTLTWPTNGPT